MREDQCLNCPERKVTADYNCHTHCKHDIKRRLLAEFRYRKAKRMNDARDFSFAVVKNIRRKEEKERMRRR